MRELWQRWRCRRGHHLNDFLVLRPIYGGLGWYAAHMCRCGATVRQANGLWVEEL